MASVAFVVSLTCFSTLAADSPFKIGESMSNAKDPTSAHEHKAESTSLQLPDDLRDRLASHQQRFEEAAEPENDFRIEIAKYVDHECSDQHWQRLNREINSLARGTYGCAESPSAAEGHHGKLLAGKLGSSRYCWKRLDS